MAAIVYALCAATALVCAGLLLRSFWRSGVRLLLWSSLCFAAFCLANVFLFIDLIMVPEYDLLLVRSFFMLAGVFFLLYGLIWEGQ